MESCASGNCSLRYSTSGIHAVACARGIGTSLYGTEDAKKSWNQKKSLRSLRLCGKNYYKYLIAK